MSLATRLCTLVCCLPLAAQSSPGLRVDSASFGMGFGTQGVMFTVMHTGPTFGYFGGFGGMPDTSSTSMNEPASGNPSWVQHKSTTSEAHLGVAYRLDSRWVIGLGAGYSSTMYRYSYNPGSNPFPAYTTPPSPGPLSDSNLGMVAMADVRLGPAWGVELIGGSVGFGASVTFRF